MPAKSHILATLNIPREYYLDFLRGLFDGDGTTYSYIDKRWKSSFMFCVSFAAASRPFLDYIQLTSATCARMVKGTIRSSTRAHSLAYAKSDSLKLVKFMYDRDELPYLARKGES
jgi:hypothetical protein